MTLAQMAGICLPWTANRDASLKLPVSHETGAQLIVHQSIVNALTLPIRRTPDPYHEGKAQCFWTCILMPSSDRMLVTPHPHLASVDFFITCEQGLGILHMMPQLSQEDMHQPIYALIASSTTQQFCGAWWRCRRTLTRFLDFVPGVLRVRQYIAVNREVESMKRAYRI